MPKSDQGVDTKRYCVIPRTLIFLFDSENRVLLLKGSKKKRLWAGLYNGIGGHIEAGEDVLEAAKRELFEEAGIDDIDLRLCGQIMVDVRKNVGVGIFIFRGDFGGQEMMDSPEGVLKWVQMEAIENTPLVEDLSILLPKVMQNRPGERLIIGKYRYLSNGKLKIVLH